MYQISLHVCLYDDSINYCHAILKCPIWPEVLCYIVFVLWPSCYNAFFQLYRWMFLILFCDIIKAESGSEFSKNRKYFQCKTSFCQFSNIASTGLQKMLTSQYHCGVMCCCKIFLYNGVIITIDIVGRCYAYLWQMLLPIFRILLWQMVGH